MDQEKPAWRAASQTCEPCRPAWTPWRSDYCSSHRPTFRLRPAQPRLTFATSARREGTPRSVGVRFESTLVMLRLVILRLIVLRWIRRSLPGALRLRRANRAGLHGRPGGAITVVAIGQHSGYGQHNRG